MKDHLRYIRYSLLRFVTLGIYIFITNGCISLPAILVLILGAMVLFLTYVLNAAMPDSLDYLRQPAIWLSIFEPAYACVSISQGLALTTIMITCMKITVICLPVAAILSYIMKKIFGA